MKYKDFVTWCNERACDGQWSLKTVLIVVDVTNAINKKFFWQREKAWRSHPLYEEICKYITEVWEDKR